MIGQLLSLKQHRAILAAILCLIVGSGCGVKGVKNKSIEQPHDAIGYAKLGSSDAKKHDFDKAIADFSQAITLDPNFAESYSARALIYANVTHDYDHAIADYNKVLELKPEYKKVYSLRGLAYLMQNKYREAVLDMSHAILDNQDVLQNYNNRCYCLDKLGQYDKALMDCNNAIILNPSVADSYDTRSAVYLHQKDYDHSWGDVKKVIELGGTPSPDTLQELKKESNRT